MYVEIFPRVYLGQSVEDASKEDFTHYVAYVLGDIEKTLCVQQKRVYYHFDRVAEYIDRALQDPKSKVLVYGCPVFLMAYGLLKNVYATSNSAHRGIAEKAGFNIALSYQEKEAVDKLDRRLEFGKIFETDTDLKYL